MNQQLSSDRFGVNRMDGMRIATFSSELSKEEKEKYGKLFEAAPRMLEALKSANARLSFLANPVEDGGNTEDEDLIEWITAIVDNVSQQ